MVIIAAELLNHKNTVKALIATGWTYGAVGTGSTTPTSADTTLTTETLRKLVQTVTNGSTSVTLSIYLGATECNGTTLREFGFLDAPSAGNLKQHLLLTNAIAKTSAYEVWVDSEIEPVITEVML